MTVWMLVAVIELVTALTRFLPFMVFRGDQKVPPVIDKLGKMLPFAIMGMLVVYCLKGVRPLAYPYGLPELIAIAVVALLHIWKRNTLLSIVSGTVAYMLLVQVIFS